MKKDFVDFLNVEFRERPGMYLGEYSISKLGIFLSGFMVGSFYYDKTKTSLIRFNSFIEWFEIKYSLERCSSWTYPFLEMRNNDEKAAMDLFFEELAIFIAETSR